MEVSTMTLWQSFKRLLDPSETLTDQTFRLERQEEPGHLAERAPVHLRDAAMRAENVVKHIESVLQTAPQGPEAVEKAGNLSEPLQENIDRLKALFRMPPNKDLVLREFEVATQPPTRAVICFMEGLSDKTTINDSILQPLMLLSHLDHHVGDGGEYEKTAFTIRAILHRLLPGNQVSEKYTLSSIAESLLSGDSVLIFDGCPTAIAVETKGFPGRSVSDPKNEQVVQGPHDAFVESFRVNVTLVRRRLKDPRVVTEILSVGQVSNTYVGLMYIDGIAAPKLIAEVKRRIDSLKVDAINSAGALEQYIEDSPSSLFPGALTTERPDRVAAYLQEGHIALVVDNSPLAIVCPITFWALLQTAEDYYLRYPFGTFLRYIRFVALLVTLLVPASYVAIFNYHQEMIPTQLLFFVASTRENVPMPAAVELLGMDLAFELVREAGVRIPSVIGPTIGLVASLILGQAAVEANIVSPLMILVVAITGLSSFAIPNYLTNYGLRASRFLLILAALLLGFYGLAAGLFLFINYLAGMRSFGVPYLSPVAPTSGGVTDIFNRPHLFAMEKRPSYTEPLNERRQKPIVRPWDPFAPDKPKSDGGSGEGGLK
jgi:spore germination protein KA